MTLIWILVPLACFIVVWLLPHAKTSRPDGTLLPKVHPYRTMMQYIMPTRAESVVYYDLNIPADALLSYIEEAKEPLSANMSHCLVAAVAVGIEKCPEMNQFPSGYRLYQRKGRWITFSMKRKKLDKKAKIATVKKEIPEGVTFAELCQLINGDIKEQRSDKVTYHDKEYSLLTKLPRPFLSLGIRIVKWLDYHNLLPADFIEGDALYTSAFIANLGSLGMDTAYHHLYEWGNCPLFLMCGKVVEQPVVVDGEVRIQSVLPIRITYDERIDDGLTASHGLKAVEQVLCDPRTYLGCLKADGSDTFPMGQPNTNERN